MYEQGKEYARATVQKYYSNLIGEPTRGPVAITPSEFLMFIVNMPESQVDSLKAAYCTPEQLAELETYQDLRENKLIEASSAEDVAKLYSFIDEYISVGGRSYQLLEEASRDTHPLIQLGMAIAAASVDEMLVDYPTTRIDYDCLAEVLRNNGLQITSDVLLDVAGALMIEVAPEISVEELMIELGVSASEITMLTIQYKDCCAKRWHF